jgi:hypothetical protein
MMVQRLSLRCSSNPDGRTPLPRSLPERVMTVVLNTARPCSDGLGCTVHRCLPPSADAGVKESCVGAHGRVVLTIVVLVGGHKIELVWSLSSVEPRADLKLQVKLS